MRGVRHTEAGIEIVDLPKPKGDGVVVNGRAFGRATLRDGDRIKLGRTTLIFCSFQHLAE